MTFYVLSSQKTTVTVGLLTSLLLLEGCQTVDQMSRVGELPVITHIQDPTRTPDHQPVSMPMPSPAPAPQQPNSLWQAGARTFFKDQRASRVGDILTVLVQVDDKADISNTTVRNRTTSEKTGITGLFGYEKKLDSIFPKSVDATNLVGISSKPSHTGVGTISRSEKINMKVAATVIQILPNGNFVISGRQEMRVNYEVREMLLQGIVRPEDISSANTIPYEKIAEGRFSYAGRGQLDDMQQPPYGQQVLNALSPF